MKMAFNGLIGEADEPLSRFTQRESNKLNGELAEVMRSTAKDSSALKVPRGCRNRTST